MTEPVKPMTVKEWLQLCGGHIKIVQVEEKRPDGLWLGGYSTNYDYEGNEIGRTPVRWVGKLTYE